MPRCVRVILDMVLVIYQLAHLFGRRATAGRTGCCPVSYAVILFVEILLLAVSRRYCNWG